MFNFLNWKLKSEYSHFLLSTSISLSHKNICFHCSKSAGFCKMKNLLVIHSTSLPFLYNCKPNSYLLQMGKSLIVGATNSPDQLTHTPCVTGIIRDVTPTMPFEIHINCWTQSQLWSLTRDEFQQWKYWSLITAYEKKLELDETKKNKLLTV